MKIIAYYEGSDDVQGWLSKVLPSKSIDFRKLPTRNDTKGFTELPSYVSDILYLDKPDVILAGNIDGVHERPIFSIEFASCTPQYQHALQRFSRMMASVVNGCPSIIIIPKRKKENQSGDREYVRSKAVEYGAVKLMDIYGCPAFVFDWPDKDGILQFEKDTQLPKLDVVSIKLVSRLLKEAVAQFQNADYIAALKSRPIIMELTDLLRCSAYEKGIPSPGSPGGGASKSLAKLDVIKTQDLLNKIKSSGIKSASSLIAELPDYFTSRENSLLFYPTRITAHAGDPYVGMVGYYDIAFCRVGRSPRERSMNLVAYANSVSIEEVTGTMKKYNESSCTFKKVIKPNNIKQYGFHLRNGCKLTKNKPTRIYSELTDLLVFSDGILF